MRHDENNNFEEVGELLSTLKRVEPPGDFDMHVRGRIAKGLPTVSRRWPMMVARIGVPAAVLIALGGYFGWTNLSEPVNVPVVADLQTVEPVRSNIDSDYEQFAVSANPEDSVETSRQNDRILVEPPENLLADKMTIGRNRDSRAPGRDGMTVPEDSGAGGGSVDFSFPTARRRLPRGLDPDRLITNTNITASTRQSAVEVLRMLGVSASCSMSGCRVNSVSGNGVAGNSGLKTGDIIESIDGTRLNSATTFGGQFSAASVRVRREGSVLTISLRP